MHWVIKVVEAMVGPQRGEHTSNTRGTLLEKTTQIERVSGRFLKLQHVNEERGRSSTRQDA